MAKINFSRVEQAFAEGLLRISVQNLLNLAKVAATIGPPPDEEEEWGLLRHFLFSDKKRLLIITLRHELQWLYKNNKHFSKTLGMKKDKVMALLEDPSKITDEQFEIIKDLKKKVDEYKGKIEGGLPEDYLDQLVDQERTRHINKRFNVNERWLPLG